MSTVLVAGVAVADIVMRVGAFPRLAEKYRAEDASITVGGCAANAAVAVARNGGKAMLAARLGQDLIGDLIVNKLTQDGVDLSLCDRRDGARSSFSSIYVDAAGERQIMNFRGENLATTIDFTSAPRTDAVLADNRWPELTRAALATAHTWGVPGVVDAEAPFDADAVAGATHIAFSLQGLSAFAPGLAPQAALQRAAETFHAWVAVTDGPNGVWFSENGTIAHLPAFAVETVDTLGAGDIWHGAFALRLAEGADERSAILFANAAASVKCQSFGGIATCPTRNETEAFLRTRSQ